MKAIRMQQAGGPEVLEVKDVVMPEPGFGEVLLKVAAIGLNRAEAMYRSGAYIEEPLFPGGLGYEAAGTVEAVGEGVTTLAVGDRVSTFSAHSMRDYWSYAEYAVFPASSTRKIPEALSFEEGAALWNSWLTSYFGLIEIAHLTAGQTLLATAAASSTGLAALQIAKAVGASVIATTRSVEKVDQLLRAGADNVIVTSESDVVEKMQEMTNGIGADVIFDPINGNFANQLFDVAAYGACFLEYGAITGDAVVAPTFPMMLKAITLRSFTIFDFTGHSQLGVPQDGHAVERAIRFISAGVSARKLAVTFEPKTFVLDEAPKAHAFMEAGNQFGKVIMTT